MPDPHAGALNSCLGVRCRMYGRSGVGGDSDRVRGSSRGKWMMGRVVFILIGLLIIAFVACERHEPALAAGGKPVHEVLNWDSEAETRGDHLVYRIDGRDIGGIEALYAHVDQLP